MTRRLPKAGETSPHNLKSAISARIGTMYKALRKTLAHPLLAIGSTVLWGIFELVALNRPSRVNKSR